MGPDAAARLKQAEDEVYRGSGDPLVGWDEESLAKDAAAAGLVVTGSEVVSATGPRSVRDEDIERWGAGAWGTGLAHRLSAAEVDTVRNLCHAQLTGREVPWRAATLFLVAEKPGG